MYCGWIKNGTAIIYLDNVTVLNHELFLFTITSTLEFPLINTFLPCKEATLAMSAVSTFLSQLRLTAYIMLIVTIIYNHFVYYCREHSCFPKIKKLIIMAPQTLF